MIPLAYSRRVAFLLLRFALSIAPHDTLDWGRGMLSELTHVEGNWAALLWSLGATGVLARHALLAAIFTRSNRHVVPPGSDLFSKEGPMRKTVLAAISACVVASLLFFLAPVFRQAFHVSLAQWHAFIHVGPVLIDRQPSSELAALVRKAEQHHDAEALAFVAVRHPSASESARLAKAAVRLDQNLTWIYAIVAVEHPDLPELESWVPLLVKYDPQNALPHFIAAEKIDIDQVVREKIPRSVDEQPPAWRDAMASAFRSPKLDDYLGRLMELDRRVLLNYQVDDPFQALRDISWYNLPSYAASDSSRYAKSLLESGEILEAHGDRKGAFENYSAVVQFAQIMGEKGGFMMRDELHDALMRLGSLSEKEGNHQQAQLYAFLAGQAGNAREEEPSSVRPRRFGPSDVSRWNAFLARASGLTLLMSTIVLVTCVLYVVLRGQSLRLFSLRPSPMTLALGLGAAVSALLSSVMLYVSYRPYDEVLQRFIRTGDDSRLADLSQFLWYTSFPLGADGLRNQFDVVFYFWLSIAALCLVALPLAIWRFQRHSRASSYDIAARG